MDVYDSYSLDKIVNNCRYLLGSSSIFILLFNDIRLLIPLDYHNNIISLCSEHILYNLNYFSFFSYEEIETAKWLGIILILISFFNILKPISIFIHYIVSLSIFHSSLISEGGDQINMILLSFILIFQIFRDISKKNENFIIKLFLFCVKLQCSVIYLQASVSKLYVTEWSDGTAIYYWLNHNIFGLNKPILEYINYLLQFPLIVSFITLGVIIFELFLSYAIWAEFKHKTIVMIAGIFFHFIIFLVHALPTFYLSMTALIILSFINFKIKKNNYA